MKSGFRHGAQVVAIEADEIGDTGETRVGQVQELEAVLVEKQRLEDAVDGSVVGLVGQLDQLEAAGP